MLLFDGVELNPNMLWVNRHESQAVRQSSRRLQSGNLVIYSGPLIAGQSIELQAISDQGWLTKEQVDAITLRANTPGAIYSLLLDGVTYQVIFDHGNPPAWTAEPFIYRLTEQTTDYYTCTLKLLTV